MKSEEVIVRLRKRYAAPEYAFFTEVGDRTGGRNRSADGVALSLWPSRGIELHGFEVKVDRRDWLRELKDPAKADVIAKFCSRWWLVVADAKIVADGELPPLWGLMVAHGDGLKIAKEAGPLEAQPLGLPFVGALVRAIHTQSASEAQIKTARAEGFAEGRARGLQEAKTDRDYAAKNAQALAASVEAFERASGVKIDTWNGERLGKAVAKIMTLHNLDYRRSVESVVDQLGRVTSDLRALLRASTDADDVARAG